MSDPNVGKGLGVTQVIAARKQRSAERALANPTRSLLVEGARKVAALAAIAGAVIVWRENARTVTKVLAAHPDASVGHFDQYVALALAALGVYLFSPDVFHGFFEALRPMLPWGKKE